MSIEMMFQGVNSGVYPSAAHKLNEFRMFANEANGLLILPFIKRLDQHTTLNQLLQYFGQRRVAGQFRNSGVKAARQCVHTRLVGLKHMVCSDDKGAESVKVLGFRALQWPTYGFRSRTRRVRKTARASSGVGQIDRAEIESELNDVEGFREFLQDAPHPRSADPKACRQGGLAYSAAWPDLFRHDRARQGIKSLDLRGFRTTSHFGECSGGTHWFSLVPSLCVPFHFGGMQSQ